MRQRFVLSRGGARRKAFTLIEIMVAVAILAFCFLPIITHSRSTVRETETSQEDLIARHYLIDLVERFKSSPLEELRALSSTATYLKSDAMLTDHERVAKEMETVAMTTGKVDQGLKGVKKYLDVAAMMKLDPKVAFQENVLPGIHKLTVSVSWQSKVRKGSRKIEFTKMLAR